MNVLNVLREAYEKIKDPNGWVQGNYALDSRGERVPPGEPSATQFCAVGAALSVIAARQQIRDEAYEVLRRTSRAMYDGVGIFDVNDKLGHKAVCSVYEESIAVLERGSL